MPFLAENPDPRCDCVHPAGDHDPDTGSCMRVNPNVGPCPCAATSDEERERQWTEFRRDDNEARHQEKRERERDACWAHNHED
jgi:hypothetical protein